MHINILMLFQGQEATKGVNNPSFDEYHIIWA